MTITPWQCGTRRHGFTVTEVTPLPEINITLIQLQHDKTGARMVHLAADDPNNLFAVGFRTPPDDSTGVAHILEHTALCGSRKYPVRDPFFSMLKRSLNTFMNAMTASDWTLYPFSSQNHKDFFNLLGIYLDAAFFPLLKEQDFRQEGHRVELADAGNIGSPLTYKGVVYNEMKGAMSDPSSLLSRRLGPALFPTTTYRHNSGGEPADIPNLSWQDLRDFHSNFYHPSNAYFFTYGNFELDEILEVIEGQALSGFDRRDVASEVPPETRRDRPCRVEETFPLDPGTPTEKRTMVQMAWLCCDINDGLDRLSLSLLASLLLGNSAAPLYKALLDSGLGSNLAPGVGYHDDYRTTFFAAGLQGTEPEQVEAIEELILATLEQSARDGFSQERIDGIIHRLEFTVKEVIGDQYPYSLALLMRMIGPWIHGGEPVDALRFDALLTELKEKLAAGPYFQDLIRRYLLDNPHRVTLTLKPDTGLKEQQEQATIARLEQLRKTLDEKQLQAIQKQAHELETAQEKEDDLSCLPTLELADIPAQEAPVASTAGTLGGRPVRWFAQPTNGISYVNFHLSTNRLPEQLLPLVPIFCTLLTQIGAAGHSHTEMAERMEAATGGIHARTVILDVPDRLDRVQSLVTIKGKALVRNQSRMFEILGDICRAPDFTDLKRLHTVINQVKASLENSIPGAGHSYAARSAASGLTPAARLREMWNGLEQYRQIKQLAEKPPEQLADFAGQMKTIAALLLQKDNFDCAVTAEETSFPSFAPALESFFAGIPTAGSESAAPAAPFASRLQQQGWAASVPVNYVSRVFKAVPFTHPDSAALMVLSKLMRANFLHREIREKGGAYGGMASYSAEGGIFSLLSYRDPHLVRTLKVFDDAVRWAMAGKFDREQIKEAILSIFSDLDRPLSPGSRGSQEFANICQGLTLEMRNALRGRILAMDRETLAAAAARYLAPDTRISSVGVVAGETALKQANLELGDEALAIEQI